MLPCIAEFLGTMILILLGDGVVANITLSKSGIRGADSIQITFTWGLTVMFPAFIFGAVSDARFNPALTIALAVNGSLAWALVPGCIVAQFADTLAGAVLVYLLFRDQFDTTESAATKLGVFSAGPSIPNMGRSILSEATDTFVLVLAIKGIGQVAGIPAGVDKLLMFGIVVSVGISLGGLTGYAINPARDLGPHIARAVFLIKDKGDSSWGCAPVVIIDPVVGAMAAALPYQAIPWA